MAIGDGSLAAVRGAIPGSCYRRSTQRGLRAVVCDVAVYIVVLWALAVTNRWWIDVPLVLLAGAVVSGLFVLGHDAAHDALTDSDALNRRLAKEPHPLVARRLLDLGCRSLLENQLADAVGQIEQLANCLAPLEAGAVALDTAGAFVEHLGVL